MAKQTMNGETGMKLEEALGLLNEAAREKKDDVLRLLDEKYGDMKETLIDVAIGNREIMKQIRRTAEDRVKSSPWQTLGAIAAAAAVAGFCIGSARKRY